MSCPLTKKECDTTECYLADPETLDCYLIHGFENLAALDKKLDTIIELLTKFCNKYDMKKGGKKKDE